MDEVVSDRVRGLVAKLGVLVELLEEFIFGEFGEYQQSSRNYIWPP